MAFKTIEGETAKETFERFLAGQKEASYTLGDYTSTVQGDMELYTELKIAVDKEAKKKSDFMALREAAFQELAEQHDTERQALATTWQSYEDNDYTVPQ